MSFLNSIVKHRIAYSCLDCEREVRIPLSRHDYKESFKCIACGGRLVDKWMVGKYEHLKKENNKKVPLLQIELDTYGSVPRVYHKGEEITAKVSVEFRWKTKDELSINSPFISIKHIDKSDLKGVPAIRHIEYRSIEEQE